MRRFIPRLVFNLAIMAMVLCFDVTGQPITCKSKAALQVFNKGITEYVFLRDPFYHLFEEALRLEDNELVIVHSLLIILHLINLKPPDTPAVSPHLDAVNAATNSERLCERERAYMRSAIGLASGDPDKATEELCRMLLTHPRDILALRLAADIFGAFGEHRKSRDACARAMPFWTEDMPLYPGLLANYGFALEESKERERGAELCRKALSMEQRLPFATHGLVHVYEELCDPREGVEFLVRTRSDWSGQFAGHITWHLILYYLDLGDLESVFREYDAVLQVKAVKENVKGLLDASSLLWRLEMSGVAVGEKRWETVTEGMKHHIQNHRSPWFCAHIMFSLARGKVTESAARLSLAHEMIRSMENYSSSEIGGIPNKQVTERLGVPVCTALLAYGEEKYEEVLQIMLPLRHKFIRFGGSWSQRQVFNVTMIQAAVKANNGAVATGLVAEMMGHKPCNPKYQELLKQLKKQITSINLHADL